MEQIPPPPAPPFPPPSLPPSLRPLPPPLPYFDFPESLSLCKIPSTVPGPVLIK